MADDTETPGPFDLDLFPHSLGPLLAADDKQVRVILMPWSSRLGKTILGMSLLASCEAQAPRPAMVAREDKDRVDDLITAQFYPLLESCGALKKQLPPPHRRDPKHGVKLAHCRIRRAYSGSPATMAGFPACYALASEVSKWSKKRSTEADPIYLFKKRGMMFPFDSLYIFESTPAEKDHCNITTLCDAAGVDVRSFNVPCPHCGTFQMLTWGAAGDDTPGVKWDKPHGTTDLRLAEETAYYRCAKGCRIESHERNSMITRGRWISEGQFLTKSGQLRGTPKQPHASTVAFGHPERAPFGALYSLVISGWGQLVREWIEVKGTREGRREFFNQTLGRTWDPQPQRTHPGDLAERIGEDIDLGVVPPWASFLTGGIDVGRAGDEYHFYYAVCAWGLYARGHLVSYGIAYTADELLKLLRDARYAKPAADRWLAPLLWTIDSGSFTAYVYELARSLPATIIPIKGSSAALDRPFQRGIDGPDLYAEGHQLAGLSDTQKRAKRRSPRKDLLVPNTHALQSWLQDRLDGYVKRDHLSAFTVPTLALELRPVPEIDLAQHLVGDYLTDRGTWEKVTERQDIRDGVRYARVAAEVVTAGGTLWSRLPEFASTQSTAGSPVLSAGEGRPDGRPW